jgi:uncharacterized protein (DUF1778 family)
MMTIATSAPDPNDRPKRIKSALHRAADLAGKTLEEFVMGTPYERAVAQVGPEHVVQLSEPASIQFAQAILEPAVVDQAVVNRFLEAHKKSQA